MKHTFLGKFAIKHGHDFLQSNLLLYFVVAILAVKIITIGMYLPISQNFFFADITKIDLVNLLNQNRQSLGLNALTESEKLDQAAMLKAQDMVKNDYFAHQSPDGKTPWFWFAKAGYSYHYAGENLAVGFFDSKVVYDAWFNSPSHKENLLNKNYTEVGTAVLNGFEGNSIVVVQEFGSPLTKTTSVQASSKAQTPAPKPAETTPAKPEPVQEIAASNVIPKVLSQTTEYIEGPQHAGIKSAYLQLLNFIVYDNNTFLKNISLVVLILILFCLMINIIVGFTLPNRALATRSLLLIAIACAGIFLTKDMISFIAVHQVFI